jgi:hypothetical protein
MAAANMPGNPTSSANPVAGRAVVVGMTVFVETASCVNAAATVAVAGSGDGVGVSVAWATTGVFVGGNVIVTAAVNVWACD